MLTGSPRCGWTAKVSATNKLRSRVAPIPGLVFRLLLELMLYPWAIAFEEIVNRAFRLFVIAGILEALECLESTLARWHVS